MNKPLLLPEYNQIPSVGLYLEQVVKLINRSFEHYPSLMVTPSMISNYAKKSLLEELLKNNTLLIKLQLSILLPCVKM